MTFNDALHKYCTGEFTDEDVTRCTGLTVRSWRELIKVGAVRTADDRGRGRARSCDRTTFKRAALIAVLNNAGFSLAMAGQIAYLLPFDTLHYSFCDPISILLDTSGRRDTATGLMPRLKVPKADWFDPDKPAIADPENDWLIEIYNGRFVGLSVGGEAEPIIYGDLRDEATRFVAWFPFHQFIGAEPGKAPLAKWQNSRNWADRIDPRLLNFQYEEHDLDDDPLCLAAVAAVRGPLFKATINVTLAIRKALRRYLSLDPAILDSTIGETS